MSLMDLLDDFIFGPMNLINRIEGIIKRLFYRDFGFKFAIPRVDKGGQYKLADVQGILRRYGINTFGGTHDSQYIYFLVKRRQAVWAEYVLLHAGVELHNPRVDPRNNQYTASHSLGWMPTPWAEKQQNNTDEDDQSAEADHKTAQPTSLWQKFDQTIDKLLNGK